jgi:HEAT repeat protein
MTDRLRCRPASVGVLATLAFASGCVPADPSKPWSTREQSTTVESEVTEYQIVRPIIVDPSEAAPAGEVQPVIRREASMAVETTEVVVPTGPIVLRGTTPAARSTSWLLNAVVDPQPIVRATAFEALEGAPDALYEAAPFGLIDENRGVRFVAAMSIGDAGLAGLAPLIAPLLSDPSESVRAAAIYAMNEIGEGADPSPLAPMTRSDDPEIRANAYLVLGLMGNPSAIPLIESTLGKGMRLVNPMRVRLTELQAAEALVLLGDQDDIEPIRAALFTPVEQGEITVLACDMLGRLGDEQARSMLFRMIAASGNQTRPPEIRMAAAAALFRLGPPLPEGLENLILSQVRDRDPRRRVQAASCLAVVPGQQALAALEGLLSDGEPMVRTAAAGAILSRSDSRQAAAAAVSN